MKLRYTPRLVFSNPFFILGLVLLLMNDLVFKWQHHNWFTGKLSDFAGLYIFPLFWVAFFPGFKKHIYLLTALLFVWWKSELSQPAIDLLNQAFPVIRTVDYSDLFALLILPLAYRTNCDNNIAAFKRQVVTTVIGCIVFFSFCADTVAYRRILYYDPQEVRIANQSFTTKLSATEILEVLDKKGIRSTTDSSILVRVTDTGSFILMGKDSVQTRPWSETGRLGDVAKDTGKYLYYRRFTGQYFILYKLPVGDRIIPRMRISFARMDNKTTVWLQALYDEPRFLYIDGTNKMAKKARKALQALLE